MISCELEPLPNRVGSHGTTGSFVAILVPRFEAQHETRGLFVTAKDADWSTEPKFKLQPIEVISKPYFKPKSVLKSGRIPTLGGF